MSKQKYTGARPHCSQLTKWFILVSIHSPQERSDKLKQLCSWYYFLVKQGNAAQEVLIYFLAFKQATNLMVWQLTRTQFSNNNGAVKQRSKKGRQKRHSGSVKDTLSKKENSLNTPCLPTEAKDWSLVQEYFIFFCKKEKETCSTIHTALLADHRAVSSNFTPTSEFIKLRTYFE